MVALVTLIDMFACALGYIRCFEKPEVMPRQPVEHKGFVNEKRGFVLQFLSKSEIKVSSVIPHLKRIVKDFHLICHTSTYDVIHGVTLMIIMYFMYF